MQYSPGSFSKNFAWHGTGFRKLHGAIRAGFAGRLQPVPREAWRTASGIDDRSLDLIPVNFFLHNRGGLMSVDELVFQAVRKPHSLDFDRLALFALHLNRVGTGSRVVERPAMWANEFVRERLWRDGAWYASALDEASLDAFIADRMQASGGVRIKCRTNYRHLFELCGYLPAKLELINTGAEQWLASALFLAWDRHILGGSKAVRAELIELVRRDQLYKLLGISERRATAQAADLADTYLAAGNRGRFSLPPAAAAPLAAPARARRPTTLAPSPPTRMSDSSGAELPEEDTSEWVDQEESDAVVQRRSVELQAQVRNRKKAAALKCHYDNACLFCGERLRVAHNRCYSEAAHVKALGKPHNGPDRATNMIVLCPNHHLQFDRGVLRLRKTNAGYVISSAVPGDRLHGKRVVLQHDLDAEFVVYHWDWHSPNRRWPGNSNG